MKMLLGVVALGAALSLGASSAAAADPGQIHSETLVQMGLGGMQPISDAQGLEVRAKGFAGGRTIYISNKNITIGRGAYAGVGNVNINICYVRRAGT